jgi:hypothetical protein
MKACPPIDYCSQTLLNRDMKDWVEIDEVLRKNRIWDPRDLDQRLSGIRPSASCDDLDVYDRANTQRLLGSLRHARSRFTPSSQVAFRLSVMRRPEALRCGNVPVDFSAPIDIADFQLDHKPSGIDRLAVLTTSTPLGVLLRVAQFRLPEECDRAADIRQHHFY